MLAELLSDLRYRLRALFRRGEMERELAEELHFHLQRAAEKLEREGVPPAEALRQARIALGGVESVKEASRDRRGVAWLEHTGQDLRYALRALRRNPGFTLGVVLTLGLGIGVNAAMFGILDRLLFRSPDYLPEPGQVHRIYLQRTGRDGPRTERTYEYTRYLDLRRGTSVFSVMAAYATRTLPVGIGTGSRELLVSTVSASYFDLFNAQPVLGRFFRADEDTVPVGAMVAVIGHAYWQVEFGGRPDVIGQRLHVGTEDYTIIGVAPKHFAGLSDEGPPAIFVPITSFAGTFRAGPLLKNYYTTYNWGWLSAAARRKPGVSQAAADADLSRAYQQSWENERSLNPQTAPLEAARPRAIAGPVQTERGPTRSAVTPVAGWVSGVALIVLIIACANVANLLLARALRRRREIAVRLALGVSRRRLVTQLLTETLLLAVCGAVAGLLLATWGGDLLQGFFASTPSGRSLADGRTIAFVLTLAALAAGLTGLAPILQARRTDLAATLKAGVRDGGQRRSPLRTALLLTQAALSVVLLVGALLFVRSLQHARAVPLGYDSESVLYVSPNMRGVRLDDAGQIALRSRLLEAARQIPGVERAALGLTVPFWDTWSDNLFVAGIDSVDRLGSFTLQAGSGAYFATMGTRVLRGRPITEEDRTGSAPVVLVSDAMAKRLWPGQDALGQCMRVGADTSPCRTVVGIAENIRQNSITEDPGLHYYLPIDQYNPASAVLFVRVRGDAAGLKETVRKSLQQLMPGDAYLSVTPMQDIVGEQTRSWRFGATMFLAFGGLALVLAAIGLYSVIAYDVAQRTHELGVRIALGARSGDVVRLVVGDGLRVAVIGVAIGGLLALWAGRWIAPLLYQQSPHDPWVFGLVTAVLLAVALVASALPALRASRVNPTLALRAE